MLQTSLQPMKSLNKTETPIFSSVFLFVSKCNLFDVHLFTLQLVLVPFGGGRSLRVHRHSADYLSFPLGSLGPLWHI